MVVINPLLIKELRAIKPFFKENIQPNGIDLNVAKIFHVQDDGILFREDKTLPSYEMLLPDGNGLYQLTKGEYYSIEFEQSVDVPDDMCALIIHRSTLHRIGGTLLSAWFDSNFKNVLGAFLHAHTNFKIQQGARIAQIIFFKAEPSSLYDGQYQQK